MAQKAKRPRRRVNKLSDMSVDEISLVDRGANQDAEVLLAKNDTTSNDFDLDDDYAKNSPDASGVYAQGREPEDDEEDEEETSKGFFSKLADKVLGEPSYLEDSYSKAHPGMNMPDPMQMQQQQMGMQQGMPQPQQGMPQQQQPGAQPQPGMGQAQPGPGMANQMGQQGQPQMGQQPQIPPEVLNYIQQLEQAVQQQQSGGQQQSPDQSSSGDKENPFGKSDEGGTEVSSDQLSDFLSDLSKNLEEEDAREAINKALEEVEKANERAEEAESLAKAERDHRLSQTYLAKAQSYDYLPVDPHEFGEVLKRMDESMAEEDVAVLEKALNAANETLSSSGAFGEVGKKGIDGYNAVSKLDAEASSLIEKSGGEMTKEQAFEKALEQNPSLYEDYLRS